MNKNKHFIIIAILTTMLCMSGCNSTTDKEKELADFSASISNFTSMIKTADEQINALDVSNSESPKQLLEILDGLDAEFKNLAELTVPEQYKSIEDLADEASTNMSDAVSFYHNAYDTGIYNKEDADIAYQYYTRAMTRIQYIGYILVGEVPEGENITIQEELMENKFLDKLLHDNEENIESIPIENE
ncbi:MAG: hypothetical protein IJC02_06205 [Lachnospiraceae bacterium]|nr:hypothetical protein [Lachnospiraceae bacterium]MBQ3545476.1 hypothetical protein [Lachnospiraceae bacterium]